ncbi:hypothetical protein HYV81_00800 [Candidatus Woesearchaeota archaeon]|nr:hypothetical protein [Candidatus Woesearchaeota archaeon]
MVYKQINLTLSKNLQAAAEEYAKRFGFRNVQELATEAIREKVFFSDRGHDEELTPKEIALIEKFIDVTFKGKRQIVSEKILNKALLS